MYTISWCGAPDGSCALSSPYDDSMAASSIIATVVVDEFIPDLERRGYSVTNRKNFKASIDSLLAFTGWKTVKDINDRDILRWLSGERKRVSGKSCNNMLGHIRTLGVFLNDNHFTAKKIAKDIAQSRHKDKGKGRRALTPEEYDALIAVVCKPTGDRRRDGKRAWVYKLAAHTGLRRREMMLLTKDMVFPDRIELPGWVAKAQHSQTIPLGTDAAALLKEIIATGAKLPITHKKRNNVVWWGVPCHKTIKLDCEEAGIEWSTRDGGVGLHSFRKTFITQAAMNASPVVLKVLARHSDLKVTMDSYVNLEHMNAREVLNGTKWTRGVQPTGSNAATPNGVPPQNGPLQGTVNSGLPSSSPHLDVMSGWGLVGLLRTLMAPMGLEATGDVSCLPGDCTPEQTPVSLTQGEQLILIELLRKVIGR